MLYVLAAHGGRALIRIAFSTLVWGQEESVEPRTVNVHSTRLRAKLGERSGAEQYIDTVRGIGYRFRELPVSDAVAKQTGGFRPARAAT